MSSVRFCHWHSQIIVLFWVQIQQLVLAIINYGTVLCVIYCYLVNCNCFNSYIFLIVLDFFRLRVNCINLQFCNNNTLIFTIFSIIKAICAALVCCFCFAQEGQDIFQVIQLFVATPWRSLNKTSDNNFILLDQQCFWVIQSNRNVVSDTSDQGNLRSNRRQVITGIVIDSNRKQCCFIYIMRLLL
eukprot:TRINITY_DN4036_c1_g1_i9.p2 TRINITY_DN4036_c1_g1~~TRINITY_DN4036_c1_g1_i9.p2  ORF type:complete len:186 (+),score=-17.42 TRINITY_DN4036_c1_g1_i9:93-650(+)